MPKQNQAELIITSPDNERFKQVRELLNTGGLNKYSQALISGRKVVLEVLKNHPDRVLGLVTSPKLELPAIEPGKSVLTLAPALFSEIDVFGTDHAIVVVEFEKFGEFAADSFNEARALF